MKKIIHLTLIAVFLCVFMSSCKSQAPNKFTDKEITFDGIVWRGYNNRNVTGWKIIDGELCRVKRTCDLVTKKQYKDFELKLEWKIAKGTNSGIFIRGTEVAKKPIYFSAAEMQIVDSQGKTTDTSAGANYAMYKLPKACNKPVGQWNKVRIVAKGKHIEFWLNGTSTCKFEVGSKDWLKRLNASKFKNWKNYGTADEGHIALQEHGGNVSFRNISIKEYK